MALRVFYLNAGSASVLSNVTPLVGRRLLTPLGDDYCFLKCEQ